MRSLSEILGNSNTNSRLEELSGFCTNSRIVLYGAGLTGRSVLKKLLANNIRPLFIADDTPSKQGTFLEGISIQPFRSVKELEQPFAVVVTMMNPQMDFNSLRKQLKEQGVDNVFSFLELSFLFPGDLLPYFHFDVKENLLKDRAEIEQAFELFGEQHSQQVFLNNLAFRLNLDFEVIGLGDKDDYFPSGMVEDPANIIFIDCGAFDGDTIRSFLNKHKSFDSIYAFEPDPGNFSKLLQYCANLGQGLSQKIYVFNNGLDARHRFLRFNSLSNMASAISEEGDSVVQTVSLDELLLPKLKDRPGKVFIKMDIEGAEPQALEGSIALIRELKPCLAISIYHNPNDLWKIPLYINSVTPGYSFLLRQHGNDSMDLVLYAIPGNK